MILAQELVSPDRNHAAYVIPYLQQAPKRLVLSQSNKQLQAADILVFPPWNLGNRSQKVNTVWIKFSLIYTFLLIPSCTNYLIQVQAKASQQDHSRLIDKIDG